MVARIGKSERTLSKNRFMIAPHMLEDEDAKSPLIIDCIFSRKLVPPNISFAESDIEARMSSISEKSISSS